MVAGSAACFRLQLEFLFKFFSEINRIGDSFALGIENHMTLQILSGIIFQIENFLQWAHLSFRSIVAIDAESHRVRLGVIDDFHLIHLAVAGDARHTTIDVGRVTELHIIWCFVNFHPLDRLTVVERMSFIHRAMQRFKLRTLALHMLVAIPARIGGRHIRVVRNIDK